MLSVDPGVRGCGAALWQDRRLGACVYVRNPLVEGEGPNECLSMARAVVDWLTVIRRVAPGLLNAIVLEWPQVYRIGGGRTKGDPNDLLSLAGVDAAIAALLQHAETQHVKPADWKGQLNKDACARRVRERLSAEESVVLAIGLEKIAASLQHNVLDAVGIGLRALGRFDRRRVVARE